MKKKLFRLALLVSFVCALLIAGAAADGIEPKQSMDGDGTAASPYQISTAEELYWFAQHVNAGRYDACAMLVDEITVNERVLTESGELVSDIDSLHRWTAICNVSGSYTGTFNGNGHTISGLYCVGSHAEYIGLFGRVGNGGVVKDVIIEDSYFEGVNSAGGVCNQNAGEMNKCSFSGIVKTSATGAPSVGGVCAVNSGKIIQCESSAAVTSRGNYGRAGGVCGENSGTVSYCYNTGSVTNNNGDDNLGGVCGQNSGTIENCYNEGNVSGYGYNGTASGSTTGGVCGNNSGSITNCYNTGNVHESLYTGGVCGNNWGSITSSYNTGNVDGGGRGGTGGVCGANSSTVTHCYNTGSVSGLSDARVGGVCGANNSTVESCYNTGTVTYSGDYYNRDHGGGVCGSNNRGTVINCYWLDTAYDIAFSNGSGGATEKTAEQFASGEVTWLLNGESTDGPWRQNLGVAELPSLSPYQNVVVKEGDSYNNSNFSIGNGSGDGPANVNGTYLIASADDLYWFAQQVKDCDNDANAVLMADIDLEGSSNVWTPICGYTGTFDGQGYTISGLYFEGDDTYNAGLFGTVNEGGRVKNVKVEGEITIVSAGAAGGGICGNNNGTIENCSFSGSISGSNAGGVCGENSRGGTITNCYNTGTVSGTGTYALVGGVCGENYGTIANCYWLTDKASSGIGSDSDSGTGGATEKTADEFKSGAVAWLLNSYQENGPWRQTLDEDDYPVLDITHKVVMKLTIDDTAGYLNIGDEFEGEVGKVYFSKDNEDERITLPYTVDADTNLTSKILVTVTADDLDIYVEEELPDLTFTTSPEVIVNGVNMLCDFRAAKPGEYPIYIVGPAVQGDYAFDYVNGTLTVLPSWIVTIDGEVYYAHPGESYKLPDAPSKPGYIFLGWRSGDMTYEPGDEVGLFAGMTFTAVWANMPDITPSEPDQPDELPFTDVPEGAWYYDAVKTVVEAGLMAGVSDTDFAPNGILNRAMFWTLLARAGGIDTDGGETWYYKAQAWAVENGVSDGADAMGALTREQLVTMLWRLNGEPVVNYLITAPDAADISSWALEAMRWAASTGLIEGDDAGALTPAATCTRAHAATFLVRYLSVT